MPQYTDIFARDNFGDTGVIPSSGNPYQSPDIIPLQGGQMTVAQAVSSYNGPDQGLPIISPGVNNIYVRAKNLWPTGTESGAAALYYSKASLLLLPTNWLSNSVPTAGGQNSAPFVNQNNSQNLNNGDIALANPAFLLTGLPPISGADHYCLIAILNTPHTTVTPPTSFASNAAFTQWVQNTPAVAWRNIAVVSSTQQQIIKNTNFGSTNPVTAEFLFRIVGRGFPVGTVINAQCADQACPINWTGSLPAPDPQGNQAAFFQSAVPGNFSGSLVVTATPPTGQSFQPGSTLEITYYQIPSDEPDEIELDVMREVKIASTSEDGVLSEKSPMLIELGQVNFVVGS